MREIKHIVEINHGSALMVEYEDGGIVEVANGSLLATEILNIYATQKAESGDTEESGGIPEARRRTRYRPGARNTRANGGQ